MRKANPEPRGGTEPKKPRLTASDSDALGRETEKPEAESSMPSDGFHRLPEDEMKENASDAVGMELLCNIENVQGRPKVETNGSCLGSRKAAKDSCHARPQKTQSQEQRCGKQKEEEAQCASSSISCRNEFQDKEFKMTDCLFKLYEKSPPGQAHIDIFFFHGLQFEPNPHLSTWTSGNDAKLIWPKEWLPHDVPHARVFSVSYDGCVEKTPTTGRMDLLAIAESVMSDIQLVRKGTNHPVILVGHSIGGLVIKKLCVLASQKKDQYAGDITTFLDSIGGFLFYDTPHMGMEWKDRGEDINNSPLVKLTIELETDAARLHEEFLKLWRSKDHQWQIRGIGAKHCARKPVLLVKESSSRFGDRYFTVDSDHFSVCRPRDRKSTSYQQLINLIEDVKSHKQFQMKGLRLRVPTLTVGQQSFLNKVVEKHHVFLGFSGMVGSGKTTIAKELFNTLLTEFEYTCFIPIEKHIDKEKIWAEIHHFGVKELDASSRGRDNWERVKDKPLLLVFDGVADETHVKLLQEIALENGAIDNDGQTMMTNSRFIVTGRNSQILKQIGREIHICSVPLLTDEEARRLFTALAFHPKEEPPHKFNEIVEELVRGCDGLPLAVTVVGKYLHGQDPNSKMELWKDVSEALKYVVDVDPLQKEMWKKLESSYEDLGEKEQKMFLDVATFMTFSNCPFTAQDSIKAWNALHHCVNMRLQNLQARSLIRDVPTEHGGRFEMHGHLRRIGKSIAIKLGRICESTQIDPDFWLGDYYPSDDEITKEETPLMKVVAHRVKIIPEQSCTSDEDCCSCKIKRVFKRLSTVKFLEMNVEFSGSCESCRREGGLTLPTSLSMLKLTGCTETLKLPKDDDKTLVVLKRLE